MNTAAGRDDAALEQVELAVAGDLRLAAWRNGPPDAPRVMFLHGFPEGAFVWRPLMLALAEQARCLAPSLRGYAPSSMPANVAAYRPRQLVGDLVALVDDFAGADRPLDLLVAHDWGGALAWNLAAAHPERLRRLLIINAPHPATFLRELCHNPAQQRASQYMLRLAAPEAEQRLARDDFAALWASFGAAPWLTPELRQRYRAQWSAGLTGALNFYRASPLRPPQSADDALHRLELPDELCRVSVPTTVLWGERDRALLPALLDGLDRFVARLAVQRVPQASHWLVHEEPQRVEQAILRLLA